MVVSIGLLFHAFVTLVVAIVAFVLVREIFSTRTDAQMSAYGIFWLLTGLLWLQNAVRNLAVGLSIDLYPLLPSYFISQSTVFLSGIPLFYYVGLKVFRSKKVALFLLMQSTMVVFLGMYFLASVGGITPEPIQNFTAEAQPSMRALFLFRIEILLIAIALLYDIFNRAKSIGTKAWLTDKYELLYDLAIICYLLVGVIDLAKLTTEWTLLVLRLLYTASFLTVFVALQHEREQRKNYLVKKTRQ